MDFFWFFLGFFGFFCFRLSLLVCWVSPSKVIIFFFSFAFSSVLSLTFSFFICFISFFKIADQDFSSVLVALSVADSLPDQQKALELKLKLSEQLKEERKESRALLDQFKLVIEEEMGSFSVGDVLGDEYSDFGLSDGEEEDD